jgi:hypothetical protein
VSANCVLHGRPEDVAACEIEYIGVVNGNIATGDENLSGLSIQEIISNAPLATGVPTDGVSALASISDFIDFLVSAQAHQAHPSHDRRFLSMLLPLCSQRGPSTDLFSLAYDDWTSHQPPNRLTLATWLLAIALSRTRLVR